MPDVDAYAKWRRNRYGRGNVRYIRKKVLCAVVA